MIVTNNDGNFECLVVLPDNVVGSSMDSEFSVADDNFTCGGFETFSNGMHCLTFCPSVCVRCQIHI